MSAAPSGVSRQGRLGAAQLQWMRQRRNSSGAGSPGMAAAASPVLPPAKRRRVSFGGEPDVREYTPAPSPPPSPPDRVVGGRRVRGGRRGARERSAGAALQRGLPAKEERDRFEVTHVLFGVMLDGVAAAKGGSGGAVGPAGVVGAIATISNYATWPRCARSNTPHGGNRTISRG